MPPLNVLLIQVEVGSPERIPLEDRLKHLDGWIQRGVQRATETSQKIHLVLLPEAAFSNYCIAGPQQAIVIARAQEEKVKAWGSNLAKTLGAYVAFGYVGLHKTSGMARNALAVFSPLGELVRDQNKRFLYYSDQLWTPVMEPAFKGFVLEALPGKPRVMFAICNDINAQNFEEDNMNAFPLANAVAQEDASVLFLSTAWCSAHPLSPKEDHDEPVEVEHQINYWLERLEPLHGKPVFFCAADLVGREPIPGSGGARIRYCGSSCCIALDNQKLIAGPLGTTEEGFLLVSIPL